MNPETQQALVVLVSGVISSHATEWSKAKILKGRAAQAMAAAMALTLGILTAYSVGHYSLKDIVSQASYIFTVSTLYYHLIVDGNVPGLTSAVKENESKG